MFDQGKVSRAEDEAFDIAMSDLPNRVRSTVHSANQLRWDQLLEKVANDNLVPYLVAVTKKAAQELVADKLSGVKTEDPLEDE